MGHLKPHAGRSPEGARQAQVTQDFLCLFRLYPVRIESLEITTFRNLARIEVSLGPGIHVISGRNGSGKTNFLDAIAFLASLRSFRGLRSRELLSNDVEEAWLRGRVEHRGLHSTLEVKLHPRGRQVWANGKSVRKVLDYYGAMHVVSFVPEDMLIFRAAPADRRLFLDRMMFNARPAWADTAARYEEALKHRNALLRQEVLNVALLEVYEGELAQHGAALMQDRMQWIARMQPLFEEVFSRIFGEEAPVLLGYQSSVEALDNDIAEGTLPSAEACEEGLARALLQTRRRDRERGFTTVGPHRDDLLGRLHGHPLRSHASQGQQRAFVLALKLTELELLRQLLRMDPILLLDDVSSELDEVRNARLAEALQASASQVLISTTDPHLLPLHVEATRWSMEAGQLMPLETSGSRVSTHVD